MFSKLKSHGFTQTNFSGKMFLLFDKFSQIFSIRGNIFGFVKNSRGFTLVELLVVISIIGILTSVVIGSTSVARTKAKDIRRISDIKTIQLSLGIYFDVNKRYPTTGQGLSTLQSGGFMSSIPVDPSTNTVYPYSYISGQKYCLGTTLEDVANIPNDNSGCVLNTCINPITGSPDATCNYTVQR